MKIAIEEQETVIQFDRAGKTAGIYTTDKTVMTKCDRLYKCVKEDKCGGSVVAKHYETDKANLSFRTDSKFKPVFKPKKTISAEQKAAMAAGLKAKKEAGK